MVLRDYSIDEMTAWRDQFNSFEKDKYLVIDGVVNPHLLEVIRKGFEEATAAKTEYMQGYLGQLKTQIDPNTLGDGSKLAIFEFNSPKFLDFLEGITGIRGLIPDPYFTGGGLHQIRKGGRLGMHTDFRINEKLKLQRRLNVIVYLNDDWSPEWGRPCIKGPKSKDP